MARKAVSMRPPQVEPWADPADVLVVDDEPELRLALMELLQEMGLAALGARDGEEAAVLAELHGPRLILLDLRMPGVDGWQFLKRRRDSELLARIPVVIVTAEEARVPMEQAQGVLTKPVDERELWATVAGLLAAQSASAQHP
jgi:CheY-like chemotaxis protein